jgi:hypothetical protein
LLDNSSADAKKFKAAHHFLSRLIQRRQCDPVHAQVKRERSKAAGFDPHFRLGKRFQDAFDVRFAHFLQVIEFYGYKFCLNPGPG